jgi:hypothetical protein
VPTPCGDSGARDQTSRGLTMTNIQFIKRDDHIEFAIVPIEIWQRVAPLVEEL